jgi:hypothetical protein
MAVPPVWCQPSRFVSGRTLRENLMIGHLLHAWVTGHRLSPTIGSRILYRPVAPIGSDLVLRAWNLTTYQRPFAVVSFLFLALSTRVRPVAAMAGLMLSE